MTTPPITELTTRARDVFRLVVDAYLETGQPTVQARDEILDFFRMRLSD